mmetsp:Transcript_5385/g.17881  ORF Transcript_5385/g.17881 Transcript_5385/m.17881 type:complete len:251 (-) Transcript_5385:1171-1923(-)
MIVLNRLRASCQSVCGGRFPVIFSIQVAMNFFTPLGLGSRGNFFVSLHREMSTFVTSYVPRGTARAMPMYPLNGLPYSEHTRWYPRSAKNTCSRPAHCCDTSCSPITAPAAISASSLTSSLLYRFSGSRSSGAQCVKYVGSHSELDSTLYVTKRASWEDAMAVVAVANVRARSTRWVVGSVAIPRPNSDALDATDAAANAATGVDRGSVNPSGATCPCWWTARVWAPGVNALLEETNADDERGANAGAWR